MILTSKELISKGMVSNSVAVGQRPTTYDATVGAIILGGVTIKENSYTLKPRHIIWVVSSETFDMGNDTTGLATLKTEWTHQGVLALNVGVIDPGWNGPLAAAVVNFSNSDFEIHQGMPFFRILFHKHKAIPASELKPLAYTHPDYLKKVMTYSKSFSPTFLNMDDLSRTVANQVFFLPRWGLILSFIAVVLGLLAITVPVGIQIMVVGWEGRAKIEALETRINKAQAEIDRVQFNPAKCTPVTINGMKITCPESPTK